jgi:mannose/fructose/N-acetylgalactosamine-specific phosphotransferase system component IID
MNNTLTNDVIINMKLDTILQTMQSTSSIIGIKPMGVFYRRYISMFIPMDNNRETIVNKLQSYRKIDRINIQ